MKPNPEMIDEEAPEWTAQMNAQAMTLKDLPATLQAKLKAGRPRAKDPKRVVTLRLRSSLFAAYEAQGQDWRARMEQVLAEAMERPKSA
jgi:uncharacterized protein (DUF4415 family)